MLALQLLRMLRDAASFTERELLTPSVGRRRYGKGTADHAAFAAAWW